MNKRLIRVGLDFDGVIAYNPFRVIRYPLWYFKRNILGMKKLSFWYPKHPWQQVFWKILHESSIFPAYGVDLLEKMVQEKTIEAHLISARYSFLDENLLRWLRKHDLERFFKTITINRGDQQPHLFKEQMLKKLNPDFYIEDNLDIVRHLQGRVNAKVYWIYNILDRGYSYPHKYPYLQKALTDIKA